MYAEMKKRGEPIPVERANIITAYDDEDRWKRDVDKFKPASKITSKYFFSNCMFLKLDHFFQFEF